MDDFPVVLVKTSEVDPDAERLRCSQVWVSDVWEGIKKTIQYTESSHDHIACELMFPRDRARYLVLLAH